VCVRERERKRDREREGGCLVKSNGAREKCVLERYITCMLKS
jgi:hypothetical protein